MDNQNDSSELFEIFQNQLDLEEEQKKKDEEETDQTDQSEEETSDDKTDGGESTTEKTPEKEAPSSSPSADKTTGDRQQPSGSSGDAAPSETGRPADEPSDEPSDPETETGSYIQELEREKALEGKLVLSRGLSVFLLLVFVMSVIGAFFAGYQFSRNETASATATAAGGDGNGSGANGASATDGGASAPETPDRTSPGSASTEANRSQKNVRPNSENWYTIAVIGHSTQELSPDMVKALIKKNIEKVRKQNIQDVGTLYNLFGKRWRWVVVGRFKSRASAEKGAAHLKKEMAQAGYGKSYRNTSIAEISRTQARKIK